MNSSASHEAHDRAPASPSLADVQRRIRAEVAVPSRLAHVFLLLASAAMAAVIAALLITEPALPSRTRLALIVMLGIAAAWMAYATWVLRTRRVLLVQHRVVAARMAVAFCALFTIGAALLAPWRANRTGALLIVGTGLAMLTIAGLRAVQSVRARDALVRRRTELEQQLRTDAPVSA